MKRIEHQHYRHIRKENAFFFLPRSCVLAFCGTAFELLFLRRLHFLSDCKIRIHIVYDCLPLNSPYITKLANFQRFQQSLCIARVTKVIKSFSSIFANPFGHQIITAGMLSKVQSYYKVEDYGAILYSCIGSRFYLI